MTQVLAAIRWVLHKLAIVVLGLLIWTFIPLVAVSNNITDSTQVKNWFVESNFYQNVVDQSANLIESDNKSDIKDEVEGSAINTQQLIKALAPAIPPEFIQTQVERLIDGVYVWLNGDLSRPEFSVGLADRAKEIEKRLAPEITRQLSKLPTCTDANQTNQQNFDVLEAKCIPPNFSISAEARKFAKEFISKRDGPVQSRLDDSDLELSNSVLLNAPTVFSTLKLLPTFFWIFLIAFSAITILTSRRWQRGFKEVGSSFMVGSGILFFFAFLATRLASAPGKYVLDSQDKDVKNEAARAVLEPLAKVITVDISQTIMVFSGVVFVIGAICFFVGRHFGKSKEPENGKPESSKSKKKNEVPELMRDDNGSDNFIDQVHTEKNDKPKPRDKIKNKRIQ